jgi:DNA polymerase-3 subunit epsilon
MFSAIDFETAHGERNSLCQVGLVQVDNGVVVDSLNILVQPPNNFYWDRFIDIHGITPEDTKEAPTFAEVWERVKPFIEGLDVVAHNGIRFDFPVLKQTLVHYGIEEP